MERDNNLVETDWLVTVTLTYEVEAYTDDHAVLVVQDILGSAETDKRLLEVTYEAR